MSTCDFLSLLIGVGRRGAGTGKGVGGGGEEGKGDARGGFGKSSFFLFLVGLDECPHSLIKIIIARR